eukprot:scaffold41603_cov161-Skeletonema_dohrnii-CCMP3373.AAC.2
MRSSFVHFISTPTSTADTRIHRRSVLANLILLSGCILGVWFQIYEFNSRDRERIAITVYFLAFSLLVISGIVELSVDLFSIRTVGHGSGYVLLIMSILVLFFQMKETIDSTPDRIDLLANLL